MLSTEQTIREAMEKYISTRKAEDKMVGRGM